jgi:hypothetical protein
MSRLPEPGKDSGVWGEILNDFLAQSHNDDGGIKSDTVGSTQLKNSSITVAKISANGVAGATTYLRGDGSWSTPAGGAQSLAATGVKTGAYTAAAGELVPVDASGGAITVTLAASPTDQAKITIKKIDSSANAVTINAGGSNVFNKASGSVSVSLSLQNQAISLQYASGPSIWYVVSDDVPLSQLDIRHGPIVGSDSWLKLHAAGNLDALISGAITRNSSGAATNANVIWPDSTTGVYTATTVSTAFPGAVDAYTITYVGATTKTATQPTVTRDSATGAVVNRPAMIIS